MVTQTQEETKPRFAFWPLFQFPFYLLQYTGINSSFLSNLKQTLVGKQTWILLMYVVCIKYCSLRLKMNFKIIVSNPQFNILILPNIRFSLGYLKISNLAILTGLQYPNFHYLQCVVYTHTYHTHTTFPLFPGLYINICSNVVRFEKY